MARDWWWPWWISTAIDLAIALGALVILMRVRRRGWRIAAALTVCFALVAAVLAPVVMKHPRDNQPPMEVKEMSRLGTLQLNATLTQLWRLNRDYCPPGTPAVATCVRSVGTGEIAGLGRATSTYTKLLPGDDENCLVMHNNTAVIEVAGKGTLELSKVAGTICSGFPPREDGPFEFTVTGGSGKYAGASGSLSYKALVSGHDWACHCGTARDTWTGTLTVPGLDLDLAAPTFSGAVSKTIRAAKGVKRMRVRYVVTATDAVDGSVPVACEPRSGSFFTLGRTRVACSAMDGSSNIARLQFTVTVTRRG